MKLNELRIGNWYLSTKFQVPVMCEVGDFYEIYRRADGSSEYTVNDIFQPLPLTEEWLLKFGLTKFDSQGGYCKVTDDYNFVVFTILGGYDNDVCLYTIEYVHQLQNLYFALTGEELTTKQ